MKKKLLILSIGFFSIAHAQNLNFTDSKFKALILSSASSNNIAKDLSGNSIAIDTNGDGEIQLSEAQQVSILNIQQDSAQKYINPNGSTSDPSNINSVYYNSHLADGISDALLFSNLEELYFWDTKSANISFVNNNKIKKVQGRPIYYDFSQSGQTTASPINLSFDNCLGIQNINDIIAYQATMNPWYAPENSLTIKNCTQITGNIVFDNLELRELYIENLNINTLTFNSCRFLTKISVPNSNTLSKISVLGETGSSVTNVNQNIELIANNCTSLQEITAETDHYNTNGAYFSSINVNGCTSLKKIKGLNAPSINLSTAGLVNLEELDCAYYNRYDYNTTSGIYFGNVTSLNLAGLPKLKILKAFNQRITNSVNFTAAIELENIDITNSCGYMNTVDVSNLAKLHTLKTERTLTTFTQGDDSLEKIIAKNCLVLSNIYIARNYALKELTLENCPLIENLEIGISYNGNYYPNLETLNVKFCTGLKSLSVKNTKITTLNSHQNPALISLYLDNNELLSQIEISNNTNLEDLTVQNMHLISQINTTANINLKNIWFYNCSLINQLDFSNSNALNSINILDMPNLVSVNIKNGSIENDVYFSNYNPNLSVCVDNAQLADLQTNFPDINFTTNCSSSVLNTDTSKLVKKEINIFPNPVKDFVIVKSPDNIKNIKVFDGQGKLIVNQDFNQNDLRIDLSNYPTGLYIIKIRTDKNEVSEKIIKN
jgi:hypothetical protein